MVAPDLETFRSHLLQMTDLLAVETATLIEARPRFAHSVLVLAEHSPLPGEHLKADYLKQLDPVWIETTKTKVTTTEIEKEKIEEKAPCLLCRQYGHSETSHFEQNAHGTETVRSTRRAISPADQYIISRKRKDENNNFGSQSPPSNHKVFQSFSDQQRSRTLSPMRRPLIASSKLSSIEEVRTPPASKLHSPIQQHEQRTSEKLGSVCFDFNQKKMPVSTQHPVETAPEQPWFASRTEFSQKAQDVGRPSRCLKREPLKPANNEPVCSRQHENSLSTIRSPKTNNKKFIESYEIYEKWTNYGGNDICKPSVSSIDNKNINKTSQLFGSETYEEYVKRVHRRKCLDYGVFPSEERKQYARWRANFEDLPPVKCFESRAEKIKVAPPSNISLQKVENEAPSRTDPLISEAIRILEASCHMLDETTRKLNQTSETNNVRTTENASLNESLSRNKFQTSLSFPSESRRSHSVSALPNYRRYHSSRDYNRRALNAVGRGTLPSYDDNGVTNTTVKTKFSHKNIVKVTQRQ